MSLIPDTFSCPTSDSLKPIPRHSFCQRLIGSGEVPADALPLQFPFHSRPPESPHLRPERRIIHQLSYRTRELSLVIRFDINGSIPRRIARFFEVKRDDRFSIGHVLDDFDAR